jgi:hypothetical protein
MCARPECTDKIKAFNLQTLSCLGPVAFTNNIENDIFLNFPFLDSGKKAKKGVTRSPGNAGSSEAAEETERARARLQITHFRHFFPPEKIGHILGKFLAIFSA